MWYLPIVLIKGGLGTTGTPKPILVVGTVCTKLGMSGKVAAHFVIPSNLSDSFTMIYLAMVKAEKSLKFYDSSDFNFF